MSHPRSRAAVVGLSPPRSFLLPLPETSCNRRCQPLPSRRPAKARRGGRPPQRSVAPVTRCVRVRSAVPSSPAISEGYLADSADRPAGAARHSADACRRRDRPGRGATGNSTVANTIQDAPDHAPGRARVAQWRRTRSSIRGSGVARLPPRGVELVYGRDRCRSPTAMVISGDLTAAAIVAVYKGARAAIGRDPLAARSLRDGNRPRSVSERGVGPIWAHRVQAAGQPPAPRVRWDGSVTASTQASDGSRNHSMDKPRAQRQCRLSVLA